MKLKLIEEVWKQSLQDYRDTTNQNKIFIALDNVFGTFDLVQVSDFKWEEKELLKLQLNVGKLFRNLESERTGRLVNRYAVISDKDYADHLTCDVFVLYSSKISPVKYQLLKSVTNLTNESWEPESFSTYKFKIS